MDIIIKCQHSKCWHFLFHQKFSEVMVSVKKRGKVYEYRFKTGMVDGKSKLILENKVEILC